jgi:hypothetical protein
MRQRQSRRLKNQAKAAREGRIATFLQYLEKRKARNPRPRRSLRIALQREGAPQRVILFGEPGFFLDDEAGVGPPKEADYRIEDIETDLDEESSTDESRGESISVDKESASDITFASELSYDQANDEATTSSESTTTRVRELRAQWLFTGYSDPKSGST